MQNKAMRLVCLIINFQPHNPNFTTLLQLGVIKLKWQKQFTIKKFSLVIHVGHENSDIAEIIYIYNPNSIMFIFKL